MAIEPMHLVQYQKDVFFSFLFLVQNNPTTQYNMTTKTETEIWQLCKGTGTGSGGGIHGSALVNGATKEIKFKQLLLVEYLPLQIMFGRRGQYFLIQCRWRKLSKMSRICLNWNLLSCDTCTSITETPPASIHLVGRYKNRLQFFHNKSNKEVHCLAQFHPNKLTGNLLFKTTMVLLHLYNPENMFRWKSDQLSSAPFVMECFWSLQHHY